LLKKKKRVKELEIIIHFFGFACLSIANEKKKKKKKKYEVTKRKKKFSVTLSFPHNPIVLLLNVIDVKY
jgi:hypothetical protein